MGINWNCHRKLIKSFVPETTNCFQGRYRDRNEIEIDIEMMYITRFIYVTQLIIFHFPPITIFLSHFKHYPPINIPGKSSGFNHLEYHWFATKSISNKFQTFADIRWICVGLMVWCDAQWKGDGMTDFRHREEKWQWTVTKRNGR